ncbi:MAG: hypothetical protein OER95_02830, partial [Acidimicrobiia bacterium]|nr:hypothetical protein [Acidimicrobiia bacterium]
MTLTFDQPSTPGSTGAVDPTEAPPPQPSTTTTEVVHWPGFSARLSLTALTALVAVALVIGVAGLVYGNADGASTSAAEGGGRTESRTDYEAE